MARLRYNAKAVTLFLAGTLSACATVIPHEPNVALSRGDAKAVLRQSFEEQPANFRPVVIEIDDDALRLGFSRIVDRRGAVTAIPARQTFYYSNLEEPQLIQTKGRYQIELLNREHTVRRWVFFYTQDKAFAFLDAMHRMRRTE